MREASTSITQLVKTVAGEVFDQKIKGLDESTYTCYEKLKADIVSGLEKAWKAWDSQEEERLKLEFSIAVAQIAKNHGRTINAIKQRLVQVLGPEYDSVWRQGQQGG